MTQPQHLKSLSRKTGQKEAFDVWAAGLEVEAYLALKGGEPYAKLYNRIEQEARRKVSSAPVAKQERYVKQATDAVDRAFLKNEKEKKTEYGKWATAWFGSLRESCEAGLKLGTSPDVIKDELRKMLESKVAVLPRQEDRNDELSRMEAMVDTIITVWKNGPGKTWDAAAERDRGEARGAGEAWLQNEAAQKIREMLISGMAKSEVEPAVRGILLAKIKILPELERKAFFDRLAQLVNTEHARYEQDRRKEPIEAEKNREKFEAWVRPWLANLPKSCMSWLEGRKFVNGAWEPLQQRYSPEKVKSHVAATLTEQLKLIPRGEHDVYIDRKDEIVAAAIMLDAWIKSLPVFCASFFAESAPFGKVRESVMKDLETRLSAVSLDQHAAYEASVKDSLARLEKAYNANLQSKNDTNQFFRDVF